jgi:hypothetical protein
MSHNEHFGRIGRAVEATPLQSTLQLPERGVIVVSPSMAELPTAQASRKRGASYRKERLRKREL